jgi:hypothetical protein
LYQSLGEDQVLLFRSVASSDRNISNDYGRDGTRSEEDAQWRGGCPHIQDLGNNQEIREISSNQGGLAFGTGLTALAASISAAAPL